MNPFVMRVTHDFVEVIAPTDKTVYWRRFYWAAWRKWKNLEAP